MKISVNDVELYTLSENNLAVLRDEIPSDILEEDLKRRLQWVLMHKYETCFQNLKNQWMPLLTERVESVPTDEIAFCELIFSQPDYKDRVARDAELVMLGE